jgi:hypothetical protein
MKTNRTSGEHCSEQVKNGVQVAERSKLGDPTNKNFKPEVWILGLFIAVSKMRRGLQYR